MVKNQNYLAPDLKEYIFQERNLLCASYKFNSTLQSWEEEDIELD